MPLEGNEAPEGLREMSSRKDTIKAQFPDDEC